VGNIVVSEQLSLDGVVEDPSGVERTSRGGWVNEMSSSTARRGRTGEWADRLSTMPKYVISATVDEPQWGNSTILGGDAVEQVAKLRAEAHGAIVVYGSASLVRTLIEHDLVDELGLTIHPFVVRAGPRLWDETPGRKTFRLIDSRLLGCLPRLTLEAMAA
jgi:dihydrofolate reductase